MVILVYLNKTDEANKALEMSGLTLGNYPIRVTRSRTAIVPVNSSFLPKDDSEREMCSRTIYVANIDKSVSQVSLRLITPFFPPSIRNDNKLILDYLYE